MKKLFVESFKIDVKKMKEWYQRQPQERSALYWILKKQKLPEQTYLNWAQKAYKIPIVRSEYFDREINTDLWQSVANLYPWSVECFPITEWDGNLYIACLEPQDNLVIPFKTQYTLGHLKDMERFWAKLEALRKPQTKEIEKNPIFPNFPNETLSAIAMAETFETTRSVPVLNLPVNDVLKLAYINEPEKMVQMTLAHLSQMFARCMYLKINDGVTCPLYYDEKWPVKPGQENQEFSLKTPSIFRIAYRTARPYHGYVVPNTLNEAFFQVWNQGMMPEHVTICPLVSHDEVFGLLLGIAPKTINLEKSLKFFEQAAQELSKNLTKKTAKPKAA